MMTSVEPQSLAVKRLITQDSVWTDSAACTLTTRKISIAPGSLAVRPNKMLSDRNALNTSTASLYISADDYTVNAGNEDKHFPFRTDTRHIRCGVHSALIPS